MAVGAHWLIQPMLDFELFEGLLAASAMPQQHGNSFQLLENMSTVARLGQMAMAERAYHERGSAPLSQAEHIYKHAIRYEHVFS
jgi:hypothetical protein